MTTPLSLTTTDMNQLQAYINQNTKAGVINYYKYLSNSGYDYATLALGVVQDNTPSGSAARTFAEYVGKITGTNITSTQWDSIAVNLTLIK